MIIQYASDLHLEFHENKNFIKANPLKPIGDVLLLAGDIVPFMALEKQRDFFNYISDNFKSTYWVPGNHEYYHFDVATKSGVLYETIKDNVFLVNNISIQNADVTFIFSTLWSKINPANSWQIERNMNDFHLIKYNEHRLSSEKYNLLHNESRLFLENEIQQNNNSRAVVITHHVPTYMHYPKQYKGSALSDAFAVELFDTIEMSAVDFWIYGHHHQNIPDFKIGQTTLLTNQLGYVQNNEHTLFDIQKHFVL